MVPRLLIAIVGGGLITSAMLIGMSQFAQRFKERDATEYFQISSFMPAPEGGRPARPPAPATPPDRPRVEYRQPQRDTQVPVPTPAVEPERLSPPPLVAEELPDSEPAR